MSLRKELFIEGRRLFDHDIEVINIVQNVNPDLMQEDIEIARRQAITCIGKKKADVNAWEKEVLEWCKKLKEAFITGGLDE